MAYQVLQIFLRFFYLMISRSTDASWLANDRSPHDMWFLRQQYTIASLSFLGFLVSNLFCFCSKWAGNGGFKFTLFHLQLSWWQRTRQLLAKWCFILVISTLIGCEGGWALWFHFVSFSIGSVVEEETISCGLKLHFFVAMFGFVGSIVVIVGCAWFF